MKIKHVLKTMLNDLNDGVCQFLNVSLGLGHSCGTGFNGAIHALKILLYKGWQKAAHKKTQAGRLANQVSK